jgi:hypothetical protein
LAYRIDFTSPAYIQGINAETFDNIALQLFLYQYEHNDIYKNFTNALHILPDHVKTVEQIPFLPVSFFKTHRVTTGKWNDAAFVFESSGTTGEIPSKHYVHDAKLYEDALLAGFDKYYGQLDDYVILALLPSYLERGNSSLVHMAKVLIEKSGHGESGFYLDEFQKLHDLLRRLEHKKQKTLLLGVTFALLDFAALYPMKLEHTIVMETGGMKGRREEMTRSEVHDILKRQWHLNKVHSEYGMTELLSQAYSKGDGIFRTTDTMKILTRDMNDPMDVKTLGNGLINVIDLANVYSCAFIATDDIGNIHKNGAFEVVGRADNAALRGCSLMVL